MLVMVLRVLRQQAHPPYPRSRQIKHRRAPPPNSQYLPPPPGGTVSAIFRNAYSDCLICRHGSIKKSQILWALDLHTFVEAHLDVGDFVADEAAALDNIPPVGKHSAVKSEQLLSVMRQITESSRVQYGKAVFTILKDGVPLLHDRYSAIALGDSQNLKCLLYVLSAP